MLLLTGATGYVGGRLLRRLEQEGLRVKCLCRDPEALRWRVAPGTELVRGDLLQPASLDSAFLNVDTAFYLVHSMNGRERFEADEAACAANFATAASKAGVRRIVYLGALASGGVLSPHMRTPVGDRPDSALRRGSGARISGFGDHRFGKRLLRIDPGPCRAAPRHDHSSVGQHCRTTHRHRGCHRVPDGGDPRAAARECHRTNRR